MSEHEVTCDGCKASLRALLIAAGDVTDLRAENDRLRAALTEMLRVHGGSHSEDCHACGAHDDDVSDDPDTPDPHCDCGALATRQAARAALRGGT